MPLNPQVEAMLAMFADMPPFDFSKVTPTELRAAYDQPIALAQPLEVAWVEQLAIALPDRTLDGRLYVPQGAGERPPLTVFFHGGGWAIGTLDTLDGTCRALARASGSAVLSLAYRLAPEHPYPAAIEDCFDALRWAASSSGSARFDNTRLAVAGDSAGANLAAAVAICARDRGGPDLRHQLLFYPVTDADFSTASYCDNGGGAYFLSTAMMRWFWEKYLGETSPAQAPLALVLHTESLAGLPPATVITAEFDPLRDEGMAYAARLAEAGVNVDATIATGMIHGFASMYDGVPDAHHWIDKAGARLRSALSRDAE